MPIRQFAILPASWAPNGIPNYDAMTYCGKAGVTEMAIGIPPNLKGLVLEDSLPCVHTEILPEVVFLDSTQKVLDAHDPTPVPPPVDPLVALERRVALLEKQMAWKAQDSPAS